MQFNHSHILCFRSLIIHPYLLNVISFRYSMAVSLCLGEEPLGRLASAWRSYSEVDKINSAQGGKKLKVMLLVKETGESNAGFSVHKE